MIVRIIACRVLGDEVVERRSIEMSREEYDELFHQRLVDARRELEARRARKRQELVDQELDA
jgi:hypothetical protein